jgi:hypothetical protein
MPKILLKPISFIILPLQDSTMYIIISRYQILTQIKIGRPWKGVKIKPFAPPL